ncbi:DNA replication licensing factor mcm10 [Coniochaeta hoffmannii]|uniref:DNA replication licensing factor mcm10 n=1 Tax=Coniochaeta hoffmannii TaxID=91930 RepID=A0AA38SKS5_9PEZI|nr:DNA replication licensing factor mcm10 [Coniochaeta hoffmannii]
MASQWPPRSPHEALLSTPGGRERLRRMQDRTSPSPSPSKSRSNRLQAAIEFEDDDDDDDEDVEMLELRLQAIKAKLKLKKLQAARDKQKTAASSDVESSVGRRPESAAAAVGVPLQSRLAAAREKLDRDQDAARAASAAGGVQVPASPVRKVQPRQDATSPQRVILGIDKGLRAADVSLKRAPSFRKTTEENGGYLRRARTPNLTAAQKADREDRPKSFNERLAVARSEEAQRTERLERIQRLRTQNFGLGQQEMEQYKSAAVDLPDLPSRPEEFSRADILRTLGKPVPREDRSHSTSTPRDTSQPPDSDAAPEASASFDSYSGFHLSKRILPHQVLTRTLAQKRTYLIKDLLLQVKAPDWSLPDEECDIVVFAIIAGKSDPRHHAPRPGVNGKPPTERGKYMVLTLVDLEYEIELFLFDEGFSRWWKLQPGTVVAILNPGIMPPAPGKAATGRFSLVINSDADMILEVGNARDLGFCKSVKKDGSVCSCWVNRKRTEYCEFHTNEAVRKVRSGRMELNSDSFGGGSGNGMGPRGKWLKSRKKEKEEEEERKRGGYDRSTGTQFFVSTAALIDGETGIVDRVEREEALKRRLMHKERERDIAKKLGEIGGGAGKEYMSRAAAWSDTPGATAFGAAMPGMSTATGTLPGEKPPRPDARKLGLVAPRGEQPKVDLGRAKRKRPESALSGTSASTAQSDGLKGRAAFGWGTTLSTKLSRMKEGEKLDGSNIHGGDIAKAFARVEGKTQRETSPVRKKTRFVTEKGIREAGRESLGEPLSAAAKIRRQVLLDDSDDDDLVIVK